jgi:hypothetical protein
VGALGLAANAGDSDAKHARQFDPEIMGFAALFAVVLVLAQQ